MQPTYIFSSGLPEKKNVGFSDSLQIEVILFLGNLRIGFG